jgi:hypothetical protein
MTRAIASAPPPGEDRRQRATAGRNLSTADEHLGRSRNRAYVCLAREHFNDAGPKYAVRVGNDYYKLPAIQSATTFERLASRD